MLCVTVFAPRLSVITGSYILIVLSGKLQLPENFLTVHFPPWCLLYIESGRLKVSELTFQSLVIYLNLE